MDGSLLQKWKKSAMKKCILPGVHLNPGVYRRQINFFRKGMLNLAFETNIVVSLVYTFFRIFAQCVEEPHASPGNRSVHSSCMGSYACVKIEIRPPIHH